MIRGGPLLLALGCACVGRPQPVQCAVDDDCGAGAACFAGACLAGQRLDGGTGWCPALAPKYGEIDRALFKVSCGSSTTHCHTFDDANGATPTSGLDLSGDVYARLVNVQAAMVNEPGARPLLRVNPGDPDTSFLMIKLRQAGFDAGTGSGMPPDHPGQLCDSAQRAVAAWIAQGAARN